MTLARPGSGTGAAIACPVRSVFMHAPPRPPAARPGLAGAADRGAERVQVGRSRRSPRRVQRRRHGWPARRPAGSRGRAAMRPVPNRLSMVSAQTTALPSLVQRGEGGGGRQRRQAGRRQVGRASSVVGVDAARPPARGDRERARRRRRQRRSGRCCSAWNAAAAASPPSAGGGRKATLSLRHGSRSAPPGVGSASRRSATVSGRRPAATAVRDPPRQRALVEIADARRREAAPASRPGPAARSGRPSVSGTPLRPKMARAPGSASSGPATTARSRARARDDRHAEAGQLLGRHHQRLERPVAVARVQQIEAARQHRHRGRPVGIRARDGRRPRQEHHRLRHAAVDRLACPGHRRGRRRRRPGRRARAA